MKVKFTAEIIDDKGNVVGKTYQWGRSDTRHVRIQYFRSPDAGKKTKFIENTVIHIQHGQDAYFVAACGMKNTRGTLLAFLFLTDCFRTGWYFLRTA